MNLPQRPYLISKSPHSALGAIAPDKLLLDLLGHIGAGVNQPLLEGNIKIPEHGAPVGLAFRNVVEMIFHFGCERIVHFFAEVFRQEIADHSAGLCGHKALVFFVDIVSTLDNGHGWRIGARSTNAVFLQLLNQCGFGVARGRLGEMLFGRQAFAGPAIRSFATPGTLAARIPPFGFRHRGYLYAARGNLRTSMCVLRRGKGSADYPPSAPL